MIFGVSRWYIGVKKVASPSVNIFPVGEMVIHEQTLYQVSSLTVDLMINLV